MGILVGKHQAASVNGYVWKNDDDVIELPEALAHALVKIGHADFFYGDAVVKVGPVAEVELPKPIHPTPVPQPQVKEAVAAATTVRRKAAPKE